MGRFSYPFFDHLFLLTEIYKCASLLTRLVNVQDVPAVLQDVSGDLFMRNSLAIFVLLFPVFFFSPPCFAKAAAPSEKLIKAIIQEESGGDDSAIGDKNLRNKAYGCLQIRQPCVDDVNKAFGTKHRAEDCLGNRELSLWIFRHYMELYATEKRIGRKPTDEDCARVWNGGPNGWKRKDTLKYWVKIKRLLSVGNA